MITRRYPFAVWLVAVLLAGATSLPYVMGVWSTPAGAVYSGSPALPAGVQWDYDSHLVKMWQGERGQWAYHLAMTHEDHKGIFLVQGFYVALGQAAAWVPVSLPLIYHVARFLLTLIMVLALWSFASHFFEKPSERWLCLLVATIMSGWSWLLLLFAPHLTDRVSPIEFWLIDAYNLLGALYMPHFAAAIILQVAALLVFEAWVQDGRKVRLAVLAVVLAADSIVQPYVVVLMGSLLGLLALYHVSVTHRLTWKRAAWLVLPMAAHAGLPVYHYLAMRTDPVWSSFVAQNQTLSPPVIFYVLGYLPFLIPIALGMAVIKPTKANPRWLLPLAWVGIVIVLLYAPFPTQRRYLLGVQTPLAVLATRGWTQAVLPRMKRPRRPLVTIVYLTFGSIASILMILANAGALSKPAAHRSLFYWPDERRGYAWLELHAKPDELVLTVTVHTSNPGSGGKLAAAVGQRVFIGHWIETAHFEDKFVQVERFYDPATPDTWRRDFLNQINAQYIWYDEYARQVGSWNPAEANDLEAVFQSPTVTIYRVKR